MPNVHFEYQVNDLERAKKFYAELFGWTFETMMDDYFLVVGEGVGPGNSLSGALMARNSTAHPAGTAPRGAVLVWEVDDVNAKYALALGNGGAEAAPPEDYEGVGRVAYCEDGEGNLFGMLQPLAGDE